jgi:cytochrome c-type biogenesis protein CcmH
MTRTLEPRRHEDTTEGFCAPWASLTYSSCLRVFVVTALAFLFVLPALAVLPNERLADPALEARARTLSQELRCMVCQNQSIDDSNADLAHDLRVLVRERLAAGDSDAQVLAYLTSRYGDYVLLKPPLKPTTWFLWFGSPALLVSGGLALLLVQRRCRAALAAAPLPLNAAEEQRLARLLDEDAE